MKINETIQDKIISVQTQFERIIPEGYKTLDINKINKQVTKKAKLFIKECEKRKGLKSTQSEHRKF